MTEEEMIAEQRRLFEKAKNYEYSDHEDTENGNGDHGLDYRSSSATINYASN
jgi:hypothetical protein